MIAASPTRCRTCPRFVEVDGDLITSFESGAAEYAHPLDGQSEDDLWASPYMTRTPLGELGLSEELTVEPGSLRSAATDLLEPADTLRTSASTIDGVRVQAAMFGEVPAAGRLSSSLNQLLETAADSLRTGSRAVGQLSGALKRTGDDYEGTDLGIGRALDWLTPW